MNFRAEKLIFEPKQINNHFDVIKIDKNDHNKGQILYLKYIIQICWNYQIYVKSWHRC